MLYASGDGVLGEIFCGFVKMWNFRNYPGNMTYVRGYFRRKRRRRNLGLTTLLVIGLVGWFLWKSGIWILLVIVGSIILAIYIKTHWKRWRLARLERQVRKLESKRQDKKREAYLRKKLQQLKTANKIGDK